MPSREKIIKGLEHCMTDEDCTGCPYDGECDKMSEALDSDVFALLTESVKPIKTPETIRAEYNCGNCQCSVGIRFYDGFWYFKAHYCPHCGKKVDWDDDQQE